MNVILEEKKNERGSKVFISKLNTRLKNSITLFVPAYLHVLHFLVIIIIIFILFTMTTLIYATASLATRGVV